MINTGSHGTVNYSASYSGADDINNFYVGFERFQTEGISAMTHNDEKDGYKNSSLVANYSRELANNFKIKSTLRFSDTNKQYDKEVDTATAAHNEEEDSLQASTGLSLEYNFNEKFNNEVSLARNYIKRIYHQCQ